MFQSLIGFKINWNPFKLAMLFRERLFQSLIGFKINWNLSMDCPQGRAVDVSIPNRV
ncbi:unknown protein [Microcystis aeruginosa NIES-843]|uniref:Uncharacterized protein n=1 Tax=Microcystis aeruginosa (strain NIES-843 / IAM M-2473) TaxID=449447 RepID=B0JKX5_MICAN|nr:unknown protein [Microcystis aeruginosa NIES-843]